LLKILAGIYQADKGKVHVNGLISPFLELGIGFNPELSGRDNIYLNATVLGLSKKEIEKKFGSIVAFSELERFIDQKLKNYSSGMQVRLAFAVSIHANRDILLMDEVLAVGDTNFQNKCLDEFKKYRDMGKTVILVTHDISTVERFCSRALLLRNGKILKIGKSEEVTDAYIYQNMHDEENRILEDKKDQEREFVGDDLMKRAEIIKAGFFDKDGVEKNVFETGDLINIKILFKNSNAGEGFHIGVGLYSNNNNERIFSYNTEMDSIKISKKKGELVLQLDSLPVLKGNYYLNIACFGDNEKIYYDVKTKFIAVSIFSRGATNNYRGLVYIKHKWINNE